MRLSTVLSGGIALAGVALVVLTACSSGTSTSSDSSSADPASVGSASTDSSSTGSSGSAASDASVDLSDVTLHVGDQANMLQAVLQASGELDNAPYKIDWSEFMGGPFVIAAETGGSVDLGVMGETPVIFAQAAGSPVKVVAVQKITDPAKSNMAMIVKKDSPIHTLADLKGKKILGSPGTVAQYLVAKALQKAGLTTQDVQMVNLQQGAESAFDRGDVDVTASGGAPLAMSLASGQARVLASGAGLLPGTNYLVARAAALDDPQTKAAIADFVTRLTRAQLWFNAHPAAATKIEESLYHVDASIGKAIVEQAPFAYTPINQTILNEYQAEADFFTGQGLLKSKIDGAQIFDKEYNSTVEAAMK